MQIIHKYGNKKPKLIEQYLEEKLIEIFKKELEYNRNMFYMMEELKINSTLTLDDLKKWFNYD